MDSSPARSIQIAETDGSRSVDRNMSLDSGLHFAPETSANSLPKPRVQVDSNTLSAPEDEVSDMPAGLPAATQSEDDSDVDIRRPMGRVAMRMHRRPATAITDSPASEDDLYTSTPARNRHLSNRHTISPAPSMAGSTLFVSPEKPARHVDDQSEDELEFQALTSKERLATLIAEKRAERLAREAEEESIRLASAHRLSDLPEEIVEDPDQAANPEIDRILSDAAKPTRKASKKALLDMERETQRMVRQQALAHQMKTKKKFTTIDLFAKFNYYPNGSPPSMAPPPPRSSSSSAPNSDAIEHAAHEPASTPPSSPPTPLDRQKALVEQGALSKLVPVREDSLASLQDLDDDEELPDMADFIRASGERKLAAEQTIASPASEPKKGLKLARLGKKAMALPREDSSDDELEIIRELPSHLSIFERAKGIQKRQHTDSRAIHILKHLSHIGADTGSSGRRNKNNARPSVHPQVLEAQLRLRAKEQARARQQERIAELKAKGIEIQTSEEREREAEEFENLLEKARQEAVDLRKAEKAADNEGKIVVSDDESEDEDYYDGSENEDDEREVAENSGNELVDDAADESENEEDEDEEDEEGEEVLSDEEGEEQVDELAQDVALSRANLTLIDDKDSESRDVAPSWAQTPVLGRKPRKSHVILDDDDSDTETSRLPVNITHEANDEEDDDPFAAFGFSAVKNANSLMSPTQAFHATMQTPSQATQQDSLDILNYLAPPSSTTRPFTLDTLSESQASIVPASQVSASQQVALGWETQAPETPVPALNRGESNVTIETPGWEPTQDAGLPASWQIEETSEGLNNMDSIVEHDTQSTVRLRISESPVSAPKRTRLIRGQRAAQESSDEEDESHIGGPDVQQKDAFREMAKRRKEALTAAERAEAEREAKQMMDEQAEESEDEYAGLGGDDFVAPETEEDREMIDSSHIEIDEREMAAHHAEKQRLSDEAAASKLYKDLMTGALRRKKANMFDLDEDEDDLALRRRQMRQREEARKRKLLLQDDNIAGLAEGKQSKGKDAFLKAIADDDERDDDLLDLSDVGEDADDVPTDSQPSQQQESSTQALREVSGNKRRLEDQAAERPPAKARRTQSSAFRAPTSLLEVQQSVSFLLEEAHALPAGPTSLDISSDSENEDAASDTTEDEVDELEVERQRLNDGGFIPDQVKMPPPRLPASQRRTAPRVNVVDRLSLKRVASATESAHARTAWAAPAGGVGFKVPSLLRRATTSVATGANERGVTTSNGMSRENSGVKMGGSKKSSLAYQARAEERSAIVEASAKRRAENTARIAKLRRNASSGFGRDMAGRFE